MEEIAKQVRAWAEVTAKTLGISQNLQGMCAIASSELHTKLNALGIQSTLAMARNSDFSHVFLLIEDHILDITATQFGGTFRNKKVVYMHQRMAESYPQYKIDVEFNTIAELRSYQIKYHWPIDQQVSV